MTTQKPLLDVFREKLLSVRDTDDAIEPAINTQIAFILREFESQLRKEAVNARWWTGEVTEKFDKAIPLERLVRREK